MIGRLRQGGFCRSLAWTRTFTSVVPLYHGPAVAILLSNERLDASSITPTGKAGRLLKGDVLKALKAGTAKVSRSTASPTSVPTMPLISNAAMPVVVDGKRTLGRGAREFVDQKATNMRKVIAKRLTESKTVIPHAYAEGTCRVDALLAFRKQLAAEDPHTKPPSVNDFVIRAVALACRDVPETSSTFDAKTGQTVLSPSVDISVAVATPTGLITPIVFSAENLRLSEISERVKGLAKKARDGVLQPAEFIGGSFSISNLGMFGIGTFSAVINLPQTCILAVAGSQTRVVMEDGKLTTVTEMSVTLSHDERAVDGDIAARWLQAFAKYMGNPAAMM